VNFAAKGIFEQNKGAKMAISSGSLFTEREATAHSTTETMTKPTSDTNGTAEMSLDTDTPFSDGSTTNGVDNTADFAGEVNTNNEIPGQDVLRKIQDLSVLDREGRAVPFRSLYEGPNVTRRVLVIFIRHFFCGVCFPPPLLFLQRNSSTERELC
jgi:hypothetical protein